MYGYENVWGIIIGVIIGIIVLFLICRELICWYWKINRIVALMEEQNALLKELKEK
jgi:TctA family transporter